jgi:hypothetical protein
MRGKASAEHLAQLARQYLQEGARSRPRIFLAYVEEDLPFAERLFRDLEDAGFAPWLDRRKLLPGQNWPRAIEEAIERSDFFVACFSHLSVQKKGAFQAEIRYALDCAERVPLDETFLIPARLDDCQVPWKIRREIQYIDLFSDWELGVGRILAVINEQRRGAGRSKRPIQSACRMQSGPT